ncbi:SPOR domain-containing protein [Deinococcus sp.]|uniref:SPOR domain-containing protein n=1 Tax=Deinococcus sp. TaxID=47478 RepID=UPI0025FAC45C|nr:SPOR domain-containing protein [Deinococcus sp.]
MKLIGQRLPDLMIGILIVVLALGLGSLLLTQRNRAAAVPTLPPAASEPATNIPAAPGTANTGTPNTRTVTTAPSTSAPPSTAPPSRVPDPTGPTPTGSVAAPTTPQPDTSAPPVATTPQPSAAAPGTTPAPATPPRSGGAVATSANRTPLRRDYRISLGTFGNVAEANAATVAVRALGYAVYPIDLGSRVVAQVGPFADSATANAALSDIRRAYGSAVVYAPRQSASGQSAVGAATTPAPAATTPATTPVNPATSPVNTAPGAAAPVLTPPASSAPVNSAPANSAPANSATPGFSAPDSNSAGTSTAPATSEPVTPPEAPSTPATPPATPAPEPVTAAPAPATVSPPTGKVSAPAPSGPVYLQVGAFDRQESAQKMVGLLSDLGYNPSVQAPEGKKVTVLIGPFSGDAVLRAETKLNDNGFDHFRVR